MREPDEPSGIRDGLPESHVAGPEVIFLGELVIDPQCPGVLADIRRSGVHAVKLRVTSKVGSREDRLRVRYHVLINQRRRNHVAGRAGCLGFVRQQWRWSTARAQKGRVGKTRRAGSIRDNAIRVVNLIGDGGKVAAQFACNVGRRVQSAGRLRIAVSLVSGVEKSLGRGRGVPGNDYRAATCATKLVLGKLIRSTGLVKCWQGV